jgi:fructose-bisphosphate aldolase class II
MTLRTTKELVDRAVGHGVGVVAFNVITLEHAEAIATAAETTGLPVILQISENAVKFHGGLPAPIAAASAAIAAASSAEIALHLDHVEDFNLLAQAAACGFSSAMFDAGALHYDDNVAATKRAVAWAHAHGLWLEAELGYVGGKESAPRSAHAEGVRTDPAEAARYVTDTGVDALAVAVGSSHAMVTQSALLDLELIARLNSAVDVPLVLHGSSGVPLDQLALAVHAGMRKINVGTALNIAYTQAVREHLATSDAVDPRRYLGAARTAMVAAITPILLAVSRS